MHENKSQFNFKTLSQIALSLGLITLILALSLNLTSGVVLAAPLAATAPGLGAAAAYSALGKAGVTNTGNSVLANNVGADSSITGFPPGIAKAQILAPDVNGAEADALTAYGVLDQTITSTLDLAGTKTVTPGVYDVAATTLNGSLTLDGSGVYIFKSTSSVSASGSMNLINGATACNVFWRIPDSMTIGTGAKIVGTIIANTGSITFGEGASLDGRALALVASVTLINNSISGPSCAVTNPTAAAATAVATSTPATLLSTTGADLAESQTLANHQWLRYGLGALGIGLVVVGITLKRKQSK